MGPRVDLHRVRDVVGLVTLAAGVSTALTAFLAVALIVLVSASPWQHYWHTWRVFWLGDAMGVLVVTPLLLIWPHDVKSRGRRRRWELGALLLVMGLGTLVVGLSAPMEPRSSQGLFLLQSFLAAVNICGLLLAAALGERRRAQLKVSILNWELHQSLERLARTQSELVARERLAALGELSATLAHEVRNPLSAISNCVSALRHLPERRPDVQEQTLLDIISEEVQRLDQLVRELLDSARPVQPRPRPEPLEVVVEEALSSVLRSQAPHSRITVRREVEPDLPLALVDVPLLHMALSNLFTNALQAMPGGGRPARAHRARGASRSAAPALHLRHRPRHDSRGAAAHLRAVLHHAGQRHRAGAASSSGASSRATWARWRCAAPRACGTTFTVRLPCMEPAHEHPAVL